MPTETPLSESVGKFIAEARWHFARTMAQWPHWYVIKHWSADREAEFMELVRLVFVEGRDEQWAGGTLHERTVRYLYAGGYKYWVMDSTVDETDLINRARLDGRGPSEGFDF